MILGDGNACRLTYISLVVRVETSTRAQEQGQTVFRSITRN